MEQHDGETMEKQILKSFFCFWYRRGVGNHIVGRVVRLESSGEILGANKGEMILDRKAWQFPQVIDRGHLNTADGYALMGQNRKCTAKPWRNVKSGRDVKFANNYLNM